jgi:uncharacterized membrane protein
MRKFLLYILTLILLFAPLAGRAQDGEMLVDQQAILKAKVVEIVSEERKMLPGTDVESNFQTLQVEILEGVRAGEIITLENDYLNLKKGEIFYVLETIRWEEESVHYLVHDKYRLPAVLFFVLLFVICVFIFGGLQGIRGLVSLIGSMLLIVFVLMPGVLGGYSPILVTVGVSSLIIVFGSYITHGFNKMTTAAVTGMIATILVTGALAYFAVHLTGLSGFESEEAVYLNWNTRGSIDFVGLLFGGIMIGLLGILYDAAIGQAVSVEELGSAGAHLSRKEIFKRAIRIGREHIGALVNTLAIAYVGASLPLLLLFYGDNSGSLGQIINREVFSTEIIRTAIGSIGLVLAVPITTFISVFMLVKKEK